MKIKFMKAGKGDSVLISVDAKNILIDGGFKGTYNSQLKKELETLNEQGQCLDLVVLTHFDRDHISGLLALLQDSKYSLLIKEIWFNRISQADKHMDSTSTKLSLNDSFNFEQCVDDLSKKNNTLIVKDMVCNSDKLLHSFTQSLTMQIISPSKEKINALVSNFESEINLHKNRNKLSSGGNDNQYRFDELWNNPDIADKSQSNGSSIGLHLTYKSKNYLFLGDCHIETVSDYIDESHQGREKAKFELIKLSHHGSKFNISNKFLSNIRCKRFFISSSDIPNKETIAKIIKHQGKGVTVFCNYSSPVQNLKSLGDYSEHDLKVIEETEFYE